MQDVARNIDVVRRLEDAYNRRDYSQLPSLVREDLTAHTPGAENLAQDHAGLQMMHTSHRMTEHKMGAEQLDAARAYRHIPVSIANIAVNNSRFLVDSEAAYDYYWYGSRYKQDAVVADWPMVGNDEAARNNGSRANVLTFYSGYFQTRRRRGGRSGSLCCRRRSRSTRRRCART